jgi:hypothetical protein
LHFRYLNRNLYVLKILDGDPIPNSSPVERFLGLARWIPAPVARWFPLVARWRPAMDGFLICCWPNVYDHQWQIQGIHLLICMLPSIHKIDHTLTILVFLTVADIFIIDHDFRSVENGKYCYRCKCECVCSFPIKSSYGTPPLSADPGGHAVGAGDQLLPSKL